MSETKTRPGMHLVTELHPVQGPIGVWRRDDEPPEPTQEELEAELDGAVYLGWKTERSNSSFGSHRGVVRFQVFVDLRNPYKSWRRFTDGRIVRQFASLGRTFSTEDGTTSDRHVESFKDLPPMGTHEAPGPQAFSTVPVPKVAEEPNPFDELDPATRAAISQALGLRR